MISQDQMSNDQSVKGNKSNINNEFVVLEEQQTLKWSFHQWEHWGKQETVVKKKIEIWKKLGKKCTKEFEKLRQRICYKI